MELPTLDLKDKKILFELDKNSRQTLSELAKKVRLSKEVIFHRMKRLEKQKIILRYQTISAHFRLGFRSYKFYFKLQNMDKATKDKLHVHLMNNEMMFWIAYCQGRYDLIIAVLAKDIEEVGKIEEELMEKFSNIIQEKIVSISLKTMQYNRRWFFSDSEMPIEIDVGEGLAPTEIDDIDYNILKSITNNSRMKITDIAKEIKQSATVVTYRIRQMEKKKVILGYKLALNTKLLGYETCKAFIKLNSSTEKKRNALIEYCRMIPNVINYVITWGSWDLELEIEVKNFDEYYNIMSNIQDSFPELIKSYDSVIINSEPKQSFLPRAKKER